MRIIVTGGAGFIGSNLVRQLIGRQHVVLNLDKLTYAGNLESLSDVSEHPNYHFSKSDITNSDSIKKVIEEFQPDWIMHLAAESHVDRSIEGPRVFLETNVIGTLNLLQASLAYWKSLSGDKLAKFRFLHVSTDEVYGSLGADGFFTEQTPYDPHSPYSASKASSDHLARAWYHTYGLPTIITNCSNNYGPYQFPEKLIPLMILRALRGESLPVYGDGSNVRDWLYVEDHCEALAQAIEHGKPGETYNIGGNNEMKNLDLVKQLCNILDKLRPRPDGKSFQEQITFVTDRPGHDFRYAIDASKIREQLGWVPKQNASTGFQATVEWYLNNGNWCENILTGKYNLSRQGVAESNK